MTKTYSMPKGFYWGGASAANQYEGGYKDGGKGLNAVDVLTDRKSTRLNSSHMPKSRMPSSA